MKEVTGIRYVIAPFALSIGIATLKGRIVLELDQETQKKPRRKRRAQQKGKANGKAK